MVVGVTIAEHLAWQVLAALPRRELTMLPAAALDAYYPAGASAAACVAASSRDAA
jgi:hypothetical protein